MKKNDPAQFNSIFFPHPFSENQKMKNNADLLVHYTSGDIAKNIIGRKEFWMRNPLLMSDNKEIIYGIDYIVKWLKSSEGFEFKNFLNLNFNGLGSEIDQEFEATIPILMNQNFIACLSRHDPKENNSGRSFMWKRFASSNGVAIVINSGRILDGPSVLKVIPSPVRYLDNGEFCHCLGEVVTNIRLNLQYLKTFSKDKIKNRILAMFQLTALFTKRRVNNYENELEVRIAYSPLLEEEDTPLVPSSELVKGNQEMVLKVPLMRHPSLGETGAELNQLLYRIIISPSLDRKIQLSMKEQFVELLIKAGVPDAELKVCIANTVIELEAHRDADFI